MDLGSVFILLAILLLVAIYLSQPFLDEQATTAATESEYSHLLAERERLLSRIEELDFDYDLDKLSERDYHQARGKLVQEAAQILQKIDSYRERHGIIKGAPTAEDLKRSPRRTEIDDIEAMLTSRRRELGEKKPGFCPHCGRAVGNSDQYCVHCGEKLSS